LFKRVRVYALKRGRVFMCRSHRSSIVAIIITTTTTTTTTIM
jgi:hypothetical protein